MLCVECRYGKESPGPSAYNLSGGMGRQVLSDHESLPAWQMGTDKRFQYDFIKRTQGMPGPGQITYAALLPCAIALLICYTKLPWSDPLPSGYPAQLLSCLSCTEAVPICPTTCPTQSPFSSTLLSCPTKLPHFNCPARLFDPAVRPCGTALYGFLPSSGQCSQSASNQYADV